MVFLLFLISSFSILFFKKSNYSVSAEENKNFIKYVEFNPCYEALEKAMHEDIKSHNENIQINWIEILAYLGAKYGGNFKKYNKEDIEKLVQRLKNGENNGYPPRCGKAFEDPRTEYSGIFPGKPSGGWVYPHPPVGREANSAVYYPL